MYSNQFKSLVKQAQDHTDIFYSKPENKLKPNPHYIGFGNPGSDVLIIGKEKAFDEDATEQLMFESIQNPQEWSQYVNKGTVYNHDPFDDGSQHYINAFRPYQHKTPGGHTWSKYQKLLQYIYGELDPENHSFFKRSFITEVNPNPSKTSKIRRFTDEERLEFLGDEFYKSFKVIFLACGNYLTRTQIERIFDTSKGDYTASKPYKKIGVFKRESGIVIHCRQLSTSVSDEYLKLLSNEVKPFL